MIDSNESLQSTNEKLLKSVESFKDPKSQLVSEDEAFDLFILPALKKSNSDIDTYLKYLEDTAPNKEEAKKAIKKWKDEQKKAMKQFIKDQLDIMSTEFSYIITNTPRLVESITTVSIISTASVATVASTAALLPTGPAAAAAQLAQYIPDIKEKISNLRRISDSLKISCSKFIIAADKIYFPLPQIVNDYIITLNEINSVIDAIPIPS